MVNTNSNPFPEISGSQALFGWFDAWPSFHDAEILEISLHRAGVSNLRIHVWRMTDQVDDKGYFILDRHAVITFRMQDISDLTLSGFSIQNVISGLQINRAENGYVIALGGCFGIEGIICAGSIQIDLEPGQPPSQS